MPEETPPGPTVPQPSIDVAQEGVQTSLELRKAPQVPPQSQSFAQIGDPVATDMPAHQRAFLNAISVDESGGKYNIRYTPRGGEEFDLSTGQHPRIYEPGPHGPSSAAGRYQFTWDTWDELGGGPFTPEMQDRRAWQLAEQRYMANTGRSLDQDLQTRGLTPDTLQTLSPTWQAFKSKPLQKQAVYNDSLARFQGAGPTRPAPGADADALTPLEQLARNLGFPVQPKPASSGTIRKPPTATETFIKKLRESRGRRPPGPQVQMAESKSSEIQTPQPQRGGIPIQTLSIPPIGVSKREKRRTAQIGT